MTCSPAWLRSRCGACEPACQLQLACMRRQLSSVHYLPLPLPAPSLIFLTSIHPLTQTFLQALTELQKDNARLRAACVTLGRELLSLQGEFHAFRAQAAAALAVVSPAAAAMVTGDSAGPSLAPLTPVEAGTGPTRAAAAAAVSAAAQQQQQPQWQQAAAAPPRAAAGETATAAADAALAMPAPVPLPVPLASASTPPSSELPPGDILLVGGHDGGCWLDSAGAPTWLPAPSLRPAAARWLARMAPDHLRVHTLHRCITATTPACLPFDLQTRFRPRAASGPACQCWASREALPPPWPPPARCLLQEAATGLTGSTACCASTAALACWAAGASWRRWRWPAARWRRPWLAAPSSATEAASQRSSTTWWSGALGRQGGSAARAVGGVQEGAAGALCRAAQQVAPHLFWWSHPSPSEEHPPPPPSPCCRYDPQSNRWLPGPPLHLKRFALGGASLGGALYAVGGYDGQSYLDCAERLDPRTDQ